jgi:hypothetical protein
MAYSYYNYTGDGTTTQFPVAFGYIRREHVLAVVAGSPATFTWVNSSTIQMDVAPANGAVVRVYRQTPLTAPLVDFADGATLVAADLDTNAKQSIYTQQELSDSQEEGLANVIPNGDKGDITTSVGGTIWTVDTGAVTEAKIASGAVIEAKIGTGAVTAAKLAAGAFTDSVSSTSTTTIATPNSVKTVYDLAAAALPKSGGTMTGDLTLNAQSDLRLADSDSSNWVALQAPATVTSNVTWTLPATDGTADQTLSTNGTGTIAWVDRARLVRGTAVASTSGTSIDFTSIPSWVKRVTVMFDGVSLSGTANILIQLGDSGGVETTGYSSTSTFIATGSTGGIGSTSGIILYAGVAINLLTGPVVFNNASGNLWIAGGTLHYDNTLGANALTAGSKTLSATLDRVRITTSNGTDTFDLGSINIIYEG